MNEKHGNLSINSENIFPIIKKWLYSDHDIFMRELISNGCDAITKLKKLEMIGEHQFPEDYEAKVEVVVNPEEKTIKFIDNGIGMTAEEVEEYINQIAFSGAANFLEQYKDKTNDDQIIGHFGLGFYSAFMVAEEVHIDTLSFREGAVPVHWECDGGTEFDMKAGERQMVGTEITLFLNEESVEFSNEYRAREVIRKYCSFMPISIFLLKANAEPEYETILAEEKTDKDTVIETIIEEAKTEERENEDGTKEVVEVSPRTEKVKILKRPVALNDTAPLWTKHPNSCTEEEYREFYRNVFLDYKEPLFWIHLNMDYPFNLKGILYFPKINMEYESIEGTIKLYSNQVFVADNIKEVIPEFLMLLKGVIDCPDLPLNVSRSALQNDGFVKKISEYITKKVADKLSGMCKTDKENYEKYWDDISPFIKFGCLKDEKFCDKIYDYILFKNLEGNYLTLPECLKADEEASEGETSEKTDDSSQETKADAPAGETAGDSAETAADDGDMDEDDIMDEEPNRHTIYYVTDVKQQSQYINMFKEQGMDAVILDHNIDTSFITQLEQRNEKFKFERIDADLTGSLKEEETEADSEEIKSMAETLSGIFKKALDNENLDLKVEKLKNAGISAVITLSEESRRMQDMMKMYSMNGMDPSLFGGKETLVLNANNELVQYIQEHQEAEQVPMICQHLYDLAMLGNKPLEPEAMTKFVSRSNEMMMLLAKKGN